MSLNAGYFCIVLGETGVGKSSFINAITRKNNCKIGNESKACTINFKIESTLHNQDNYFFIDTPGLNDAKGDEKNINEIKTSLSDYPNFRCILILLKFQDLKFTTTIINNLKIFMQCFPTKEFWKHVFIVRTHADPGSRGFANDKKKIEGAIVKSITSNEKDFIDFKNFMDKKKIDLPENIAEFYVDNVNDGSDNYEFNKKEFNKIFNEIKTIPKMFKTIKKLDRERIEEGGKFPKKRTYRTITFVDNEGNEICATPYMCYEVEVSKYKIIDRKKRKVAIETESDCGDVKIKYDYYETCIYDVNGKEVIGEECYKGNGWE